MKTSSKENRALLIMLNLSIQFLRGKTCLKQNKINRKVLLVNMFEIYMGSSSFDFYNKTLTFGSISSNKTPPKKHVLQPCTTTDRSLLPIPLFILRCVHSV